MSLISNVLIVCALCMALYNAEDLIVGSTVNAELVFQETIRSRAIPFQIRTENVHFGSRTLRAIVAIDKNKSKATATIMAGGVGSNTVHVRFQSEMGGPLNYLLQIYV